MDNLIAASPLLPKYAQEIDRESAYEKLLSKVVAEPSTGPGARSEAPTPQHSQPPPPRSQGKQGKQAAAGRVRRPRGALAVAGLLLALAGCGAGAPVGDFRPVPTPTFAPDVVHPTGIGPVRFGDNREDLLRRGLINGGEMGCNGDRVYHVPGHQDAADLMFSRTDTLMLVWVLSPEVTTTARVTVGSPIDAVRAGYADGEELPVTRGSFPGYLVTEGSTGMMFLYEPSSGTVQKLLAGYTDILRRGQRDGITC